MIYYHLINHILLSKDNTIILYNIGDLLIVLGIILLFVITVPVFFNEYSMIPGLLVPALTSLLIVYNL